MLEFILGALFMFAVLFIAGFCMQSRQIRDDGERVTVKKRRVK